jgi:hypothetical protein
MQNMIEFDKQKKLDLIDHKKRLLKLVDLQIYWLKIIVTQR